MNLLFTLIFRIDELYLDTSYCSLSFTSFPARSNAEEKIIMIMIIMIIMIIRWCENAATHIVVTGLKCGWNIGVFSRKIVHLFYVPELYWPRTRNNDDFIFLCIMMMMMMIWWRRRSGRSVSDGFGGMACSRKVQICVYRVSIKKCSLIAKLKMWQKKTFLWTPGVIYFFADDCSRVKQLNFD